MLCRAVPCCAVPRRVVPCSAVPCCSPLCRVMSSRTMPCYGVTCHAAQCRAVSCCPVPCRVLIYCVVLCFILLYCALYDCTVPCRVEASRSVTRRVPFLCHPNCIVASCSGGSSIEADKALPHPKSPRSNTLQYFYLQYSKMRCIVKKIIFFNLKTLFGFEILSFKPLFNQFKNNNLG